MKEIKVIIDGKTLVYSDKETINFTKEFIKKFYEKSENHDTALISFCDGILRL